MKKLTSHGDILHSPVKTAWS